MLLQRRAIWFTLLEMERRSFTISITLDISNWTTYPSTAIFRRYARRFIVPSRAIFWSITSFSSGDTFV